MADEVGPGRHGDYVCNACREDVASDPMQRLRGLIQAAAHGSQADARPEIAGYQIGEKLGEGGMGVVYRAESIDTGEPVAVKMMLSKVAVDPDARAGFLRECEVLQHLDHPNIVSLIETVPRAARSTVSWSSATVVPCPMRPGNAG